MIICPLLTSVSVVFFKTLFLVHFSSSYILILHICYFSQHFDLISVIKPPRVYRRHNFFSFCPSDFNVNIRLLQNVIKQICFWMTANFLILNSSRTEFLLIGQQEIAKLQVGSIFYRYYPLYSQSRFLPRDAALLARSWES